MIGIDLAEDGFELVCGDRRIGQRRLLDAETTGQLEAFASRYGELLGRGDPAADLLTLGRELYGFLDGDGGDLAGLINQALGRALQFEIATPARRPSPAQLAVLRAPWELLADHDGFLAQDVRLGFSPVRRLGLPRPAPALDPYRLGLVFMAASPRGAIELDYEAEESAIMAAVGTTDLDLLVEESGNADELIARLTELPAMQALHLSCHGHQAWRPAGQAAAAPKPVLLLEDETGQEAPTDSDALIGVLRARPPRFVFLSACLTAASNERRDGWHGDKRPEDRPRGDVAVVAQSMAEALVDGGVAAVLGWDGSVRDGAATMFAARLYERLADRKTPAEAVAEARRVLLNAPDTRLRRDWHLARLWLGPQGGDALVGGKTRRTMLPARHGEKEFLIKQRAGTEVASHAMFVGRRRELQTALRALRDGDHAGLLLHGMGRLGKSSLAARIANRARHLRLAVAFEHYGELSLLAAIGEAVRGHREASDAVRIAEQRVRTDRNCFEQELTALLAGPCAQSGNGGAPLLLVIDDLERVLHWDDARQRHLLDPEAVPALRAVLRSFDPGMTESRLIITSRFPFRLDGLEAHLLDLPLPPLSPAAQRKLDLRQRSAALAKGNGATLLRDRETLLARVPEIARGNPGLQDLIGRKLVLSRAVTVVRVERALTEMESWLTHGELPSDPELKTFIKNLAVDDLINLAGEAGRELLRGLTLFKLPIPEQVAQKVAHMVGASLAQLRELGLVDTHEDFVDQCLSGYSANPLAAARVDPLSEREQKQVARQTVRELFTMRNTSSANMDWPAMLFEEFARLGLLAEDSEIVAASGPVAVFASKARSAKQADALGRDAIRLLDTQNRFVPLALLRAAAEAAATFGDGQVADKLIARGVEELERQQATGADIDKKEAALLLRAHAERLMIRGEQDKPLLFLTDQVLPMLESLGDLQTQAFAKGNISEILVRRGKLDQAQQLLEEQLPIFEKLGDARSRAVTLGRIADILMMRGQVEEALRIRQNEQLPVYEAIADDRSLAVTLGKIAAGLANQGKATEALRIWSDKLLPAFERIGDVRARAVTLGHIADVMVYSGQLNEAFRIRTEEQLPVFERLGDVRARSVSLGKTADILLRLGKLTEARAIREECLNLARELDDPENLSATLWGLAQLDLEEKRTDEAVRRLREAYSLISDLGIAAGIAMVGRTFGQVLAATGDATEASNVLRCSAAKYRELGWEDLAIETEELIKQLGLAQPSSPP
ncbi:hypothetical protein S58_67350 [Bradyrhizobium oligotrophicum S58]|uniref:CHAT domain-containing protein n=1 Tax=Bradyrhizobium oligotrophicum S58 TaxID=1245469 RepID=M4ZFR5_9BRAD|nr:tetratricopeptide repeat protein [Bradyrhizobium oligotrophicum]BAM92702.1 hypothetical protein S58_67350 [Bradyrhizobium oligotrophicum S58]